MIKLANFTLGSPFRARFSAHYTYCDKQKTAPAMSRHWKEFDYSESCEHNNLGDLDLMVENAELLEKARKLFAISLDKGSSGKEMGIAARRLKKLMDDNDISLSELKDVRPCDLHKES